jgi:VanZ family protein
LPGSDKVWHGGSYLALALPVCILFSRAAGRWRATILLVLFGAALEVAQLLVPRRSFEWADMAANTTGVAVGMLLSFGLGSVLAPQSPRAHHARPRR